ncbi:MAG: DNA mismatch repair endonuclease MutL [Kiritimatiellae bacterium]|nr:DNA mismatch repair endonuclease MutL [Kiritimatiellia bacterium]
MPAIPPGTPGAPIRVLPETVANKIAAGEVVERPASVEKELLENAVDAGARRIDVTVTAGGRKLVAVADDGCGMGRDDALLAPERQATSKIRDVTDIENIATLGFRGEALASIASVSRFTLRTRRASDDAGTEIRIEGGVLRDVRDCGAAPGTAIEVRDLFYNVPARRSFLRSFQTELAHVRNVFLVHAIAHPGIAFSLTCDGDPLHRLPPAADLRGRLQDLFGASALDAFVPFDRTAGPIRVHGFAGLPSNTRGDTAGQYVFVNGRPATAPVVQAAIREAYPHLPQGRKPVVFLFLDLPPGEVDVNVHPTKREVRFRQLGAVRDAVLEALLGALGGGAPRPAAAPADDLGGFSIGAGAAAAPQPPPDLYRPVPFETVPAPAPALQPAPAPAALPPPPRPDALPFADVAGGADAGTAGTAVNTAGRSAYYDPDGYGAPAAPAAPWTKFRLVGTLSSGYALLETAGGYAVVDPAAAHERVIYDRLLKDALARETASQGLLLPQTVQLPPVDAARIRAALPVLAEMGFEVEDFGGDTFLVRSLPEPLSGAAAGALLEDTARALEEAGPKKGRQRWKEELVAAAASRSCVRTRKPLSEKELVAILMELAASSMPYATPGGRPTMIFTSRNDLDRRFGRG